MELRELDGMFGTWRFPNNEKGIQGFLKYEDNTISITTSDSLTENYVGVGNHAIIDGLLEDGTQIRSSVRRQSCKIVDGITQIIIWT